MIRINGTLDGRDGALEWDGSEIAFFKKSPLVRAFFGALGTSIATGKECARFSISDVASYSLYEGAYSLAGCDCRLSRSAVLPLPCDGQARGAERNAGLVKENDRRQHKIGGRPARRIGVREDIRVLALGLRQVGCDVRRQLPLIGNIYESLLAGCEYSRHGLPSFRSLLHNRRMRCPSHPPWVLMSFSRMASSVTVNSVLL